jgi:hypothetical protein
VECVHEAVNLVHVPTVVFAFGDAVGIEEQPITGTDRSFKAGDVGHIQQEQGNRALALQLADGVSVKQQRRKVTRSRHAHASSSDVNDGVKRRRQHRGPPQKSKMLVDELQHR